MMLRGRDGGSPRPPSVLLSRGGNLSLGPRGSRVPQGEGSGPTMLLRSHGIGDGLTGSHLFGVYNYKFSFPSFFRLQHFKCSNYTIYNIQPYFQFPTFGNIFVQTVLDMTNFYIYSVYISYMRNLQTMFLVPFSFLVLFPVSGNIECNKWTTKIHFIVVVFCYA